MPRVKLINTVGREETNEGGCFGFTGRNGNVNTYRNIISGLPQNKIEHYQYFIGGQFGSSSKTGLLNPVAFIKWIAENSSWAKYCQGHNIETTLATNSYVDMKTDIPGHCVIGAASAVRLASHRKETLIPFWNMAVAQGCDPAIALLVFYAMFTQATKDFTITREGVYTSTLSSRTTPVTPSRQAQGKLNLSDDEVMRLDRVHPGFLYSFVRGEFEMERTDFRRESLYETGSGYQQKILSSFNSQASIPGTPHTASFPAYLMDRFHVPLPKADMQRSTSGGGMGSSSNTSRSLTQPIYLSSMIGWVKTLTNEFKMYNKFLGW